MESLQRLKSIIDTLRSPGGCPWDLEQTPESLRPFLLEEAHEVAQAIEEGDSEHICEELGDLLMNIFLQARIGEEENTFSLNDVAENISDKLIRRHPHVFGDADAADPEAVRRQWEEIKQEEKGETETARNTIRPLPASLPALCRADRVGQMVAKVGFDWPDSTGAMEKVKEELDELHEAVAKGVPEEIEHEIGDILFAVSSVARKVGVDPEVALSRSLSRFEDRFKVVDQKLGERETAPLDQLEEWYLEGKKIQNRNQE
ncbi:nucleoside triphosphate pyrophosphohydrolase [Planctomycetota bacterium]|nr:nucleoside triphosphate pyrophosphohydrolase [Planctomycetota bacterium]